MVPKEDRKKVPWYPRRISKRFHGIAGRQRQGTIATKELRKTEDRENISGIDTTSHTKTEPRYHGNQGTQEDGR